jgi:hypothetical protein
LSCDNVHETGKFFGIGAARNKVVSELLGFTELAGVDVKHIEVIADEMISYGFLGKISRSGVSARITNALHNMANSAVTKTLVAAAKACSTSLVEGVSPYYLVGDIPRIGSDYNKYMMDIDYIKTNKTTARDILESI